MAAPPPWRSNGSSTTVYTAPNQGRGFTSVEARRSLGAPRTTGFPQVAAPEQRSVGDEAPADDSVQQPQPTSPPPGAGRTTFPEKLKEYVARTFEDCPAEKKPEVEAELKRIITDAFNQKIVWSVNWDEMPLPQANLLKKAGKPKSPDDESPTRAFGKFSLDTKKRKGDGEGFGSPSKLEGKFDKRARHENEKLSQQREKNKRRFGDTSGRDVSPVSRWSEMPAADLDKPLIGQCQTLEKQYFRLTSAPDPMNVRPLHVLEKTLELLKKKWRTEANYAYICDQFKSLRQDLTVQHINNEFTVTVYEIHARIALEKGDLGEYNQCQSQLARLYGEGYKGHEEEFKAYRILYLLHTCNRADMNDILANLTMTDKSDAAIKHALQVRSVLAAGNYHMFFKLYLEVPNMGGYLMDAFIVRERFAALVCICKAYRPDIDIRFLTEELGFESDSECVQFLVDHGAGEYIIDTGDKGRPNSIRFQTPKAFPIFEERKQKAFKRVDIKGQI